MHQNHNETAEKLLSATHRSQRGFTLTELLVVITIIAILASLITVAVANAMRRAKQAAITLELQQVESAFEDFKNEYGAYPPNGMNPGKNVKNFPPRRDEIYDFVISDFERMFKKAFPRSNEPRELIRALAGDVDVVDGSNLAILPNVGGMTGMNGKEAMVFWLGGFSSDPQYPLSGPGGPSYNTSQYNVEPLEERNFRFEFDLGRLGPRDDDGKFYIDSNDRENTGRFIEYEDPIVANSTRRINLWRYTPGDSEVAAAYYDTSRHQPSEYDLDFSGHVGKGLFALKKIREGVTAPNDYEDIRYLNEDKFQILHCGIDDAWGDLSVFQLQEGTGEANLTRTIYVPTGPFIGDIADTVGNFGTGTLADEQE